MLLLHVLLTFRDLQRGGFSLGRSQTCRNLNKNVIMLVGMFDSPHFQKWLYHVRCEFPDKKIIVFPSDRPRLNHSRIRSKKLGIARVKQFRLIQNRKLNFALYYLLDMFFLESWRAYFLGKLIVRYRPYVVHFHEIQHSAYPFNLIANYRKIPRNIRLIVSTWGSDLTLYSWVSEHIGQIKSVLSWTDVLTTEKESELVDAMRLDFRGEFRSPVYITIGKSEEEFNTPTPTSSRKVILVKGYQDNPGRALNILRVLEDLQDVLKGYEVIVYSASPSVQLQVETLRNKSSMGISLLERVSQVEMQKLFTQARISIGLAISDGLPGVLVEAMSNGAFPIQSMNSAATELIEQGVGGYIVDPWDLKMIHDSILTALTDDHLVDNASKINKETLIKKYSLFEGILRLRSLYE